MDAASHGTGEVNIGAGGGVDAAVITVNPGSSIFSEGSGVGAGTIDVAQGAVISGQGMVVAESIINDGNITASSSELDIYGPITGTGTLGINSGAVLAFLTSNNEVSVTQADIAFLGSDATLQLGQAIPQVLPRPIIDATIEGFQPGDMIKELYVNGVQFDAATHTLHLFDGTQSAGTLSLAGDFSGESFRVAYSNSLGTITLTHGT